MKNCLITGAASGIGRSAAKLFAKRGWFVGLADLDAEALKKLQTEIGEEHCSCHVMDVCSKESVDAAMRAFESRTEGRLELLLNNAGVLKVGRFETIDIETHQQIIDVNVKGLINCAHSAFDLLRITPGAKMINMSSASAVYGTPDFASYSASKFAVRGLTEALNIEWERYDIEVSDVMPPFVNTPMLYGQQEKSKLIERMGTKLKPEAVAKEIYYLANGKQVHRQVTIKFKFLNRLSKAVPAEAQRMLMKVLSGY